jgi:hypothetical protein
MPALKVSPAETAASAASIAQPGSAACRCRNQTPAANASIDERTVGFYGFSGTAPPIRYNAWGDTRCAITSGKSFPITKPFAPTVGWRLSATPCCIRDCGI